MFPLHPFNMDFKSSPSLSLSLSTATPIIPNDQVAVANQDNTGTTTDKQEKQEYGPVFRAYRRGKRLLFPRRMFRNPVMLQHLGMTLVIHRYTDNTYDMTVTANHDAMTGWFLNNIRNGYKHPIDDLVRNWRKMPFKQKTQEQKQQQSVQHNLSIDPDDASLTGEPRIAYFNDNQSSRYGTFWVNSDMLETKHRDANFIIEIPFFIGNELAHVARWSLCRAVSPEELITLMDSRRPLSCVPLASCKREHEQHPSMKLNGGIQTQQSELRDLRPRCSRSPGCPTPVPAYLARFTRHAPDAPWFHVGKAIANGEDAENLFGILLSSSTPSSASSSSPSSASSSRPQKQHTTPCAPSSPSDSIPIHQAWYPWSSSTSSSSSPSSTAWVMPIPKGNVAKKAIYNALFDLTRDISDVSDGLETPPKHVTARMNPAKTESANRTQHKQGPLKRCDSSEDEEDDHSSDSEDNDDDGKLDEGMTKMLDSEYEIDRLLRKISRLDSIKGTLSKLLQDQKELLIKRGHQINQQVEKTRKNSKKQVVMESKPKHTKVLLIDMKNPDQVLEVLQNPKKSDRVRGVSMPKRNAKSAKTDQGYTLIMKAENDGKCVNQAAAAVSTPTNEPATRQCKQRQQDEKRPLLESTAVASDSSASLSTDRDLLNVSSLPEFSLPAAPSVVVSAPAPALEPNRSAKSGLSRENFEAFRQAFNNVLEGSDDPAKSSSTVSAVPSLSTLSTLSDSDDDCDEDTAESTAKVPVQVSKRKTDITKVSEQVSVTDDFGSDSDSDSD